VVIFLLKKHAKSGLLYLNIVINHHLYSATDGYTDSSSDSILNGEAGLVPEEAEEYMKAIRTITGNYNEDDITI